MCRPTEIPNRNALVAMVNVRIERTGERWGQALFNTLCEYDRSFANSLLGTDSDPFFAEFQYDNRVYDCFAKIYGE